MKKGLFLILTSMVFLACNNEAEIKTSVDSLGKKVDSTFERVGDSTKKSLKNLKNRIEQKFEKKDSSERK